MSDFAQAWWYGLIVEGYALLVWGAACFAFGGWFALWAERKYRIWVTMRWSRSARKALHIRKPA